MNFNPDGMVAFQQRRREELRNGYPPATGAVSIFTESRGPKPKPSYFAPVPATNPRSDPTFVAVGPSGNYLHASGTRETEFRGAAWMGTSQAFRKLREAVPFAADYRLVRP